MDRSASSLTRRDVLKLGGAALAVGASSTVLAGARPAEAQTPKRGGRFRLRSHVPPVHFDPHQTIAFSTMIPLSFAYSRLVKVKGGSAVVPGTQPVEGDLAESWERQGDTVYVFKLRKGVRWHNKPPVNGRELTAEDVRYTYDRFLNIKGNANTVHPRDGRQGRGPRQVHREVHAARAQRLVHRPAGLDLHLDHRQGVRGPVRRPQEAGERGRHRPLDAPELRAQRPDDLRPQPELLRSGAALRGRGGHHDLHGPRGRLRPVPVRRVRLRPGVRHGDPPQRPRHRAPARQGARHAGLHRGVRRLHRDEARPGAVQGRAGAAGLRDVPRTGGRCSRPTPGRRARARPNPLIPAALKEWSIPIDQLPPEGRKLYEFDPAGAKRLLAEAGHPNGLKVPIETTPGYGPDWMDAVQVCAPQLEAGRDRGRPQAQGVRGLRLERDLRQVREDDRDAARGAPPIPTPTSRRSCPASRSTPPGSTIRSSPR